MMIIHNIHEMLLSYAELGGSEKKTDKGLRYQFSHADGHCGTVDFYGDFSSFFVADADYTLGKDILCRARFSEKYLGVGITEAGTSIPYGTILTYREKANPRIFDGRMNFYVDIYQSPFFMRVKGGERLKFFGLYFMESFFHKNNITLDGSFWLNADCVLNNSTYEFPELSFISRQIKNCTLSGKNFEIWLQGQGLIIAAHILNYVRQYAKQKPSFLHNDQKQAISNAKEILGTEMIQAPSVIELAKRVCINKNKLQDGFRFTEGKTVAEYLRTIRMGKALELLEHSTLSIKEIVHASGYQGTGNFYAVFRKTFGDTPANIQKLLHNTEDKT